MNVYHKYNTTLPLKPTEYWIVHDELEKILIQAQVNVLKFVAHDVELDRIGVIATTAAGGVTALYGITAITDGVVGNLITKTDTTNNNLNSYQQTQYYQFIIIIQQYLIYN